jgi:hypothetical protein
MSTSTLYNKKATAAALHENINNPPTHNVTRASHYNVSPGASPTFVPFTGTTSRLDVQFNTAGVGIGTSPYKVEIPYRRIGNPTGNISVGIRKATGDTFQLIAEWPVSEPKSSGIITIEVGQGFRTQITNIYQMVASDKVSIEYPPFATDTIEIACGAGLPSGFTSQAYTGSYAATAQPLALKITSS